MSNKIAFVFPGQGSQWVGMGWDLYETFPSAREVFDQADEVLGFPLSRLCFKGPEEELCQTENAQPAIVTVSVACLKALESKAISYLRPSFVAGHSLGEYTALVASGVVSFPKAVSLARSRGSLMKQAWKGGMAAILGLELKRVAEFCHRSGAEIANINCPGQIVISGSKKALEKAMGLAKESGARVILLEVSGAFHSSLMRRALRGLGKLILPLRFRHPKVPIVANTSARPLTQARQVKQELCQQLCSCVQWQSSVEFMTREGVSTFVEIGPGRVLSGLIRRISPETKLLSLGGVQSIQCLHPASLTA